MYLNGIIERKSFSSFLSPTYFLGIYQCIATNSAGTISAAAYLLCNSTKIPNAPKNVQCTPFDDNNICVKWQGTQNAYSVYAVETNTDGK